MTVLVGILCQDGVVVGTDSAATFGDGAERTIEMPVKKISIVGGKIIIAHTGAAGLGQRFTNIVEGLWTNKKLSNKDRFEFVEEICRSTKQNFGSTFTQNGQYGALVAYSAKHAPHLCEFAVKTFDPELKDDDICFASMGSGQRLADPFLGLMRKVFCPVGKPTLGMGKFLVTWALDHAIDLNPGGIQAPARIAVLEKDSGSNFVARELDVSELSEHRENVEAAKAHLAGYHSSGQQLPIPEPPPAGI